MPRRCGDATGWVAIDPAGRTACSADQYGSTATLVDAVTNTRIAAVRLSGGGFNVVFAPASGQVTTVSEVADGAVGLALSPDEAHIYITDPPRGVLYVVDRGTREVIRTLSSMGYPRNVTFDRRGTTAIVTDENGFVRFIR